jgi:hypothetical protein
MTDATNNDNLTPTAQGPLAPSAAPAEATPAPAPAVPSTPPSDETNASAFRKRSQEMEKGELLLLVSGNTVRVRRPSITAMVKSGQVPANVAGAALKFDSGKPMSDRDVTRLFELKQIVTTHALMAPKIVEGTPDYDNNEISIDDLTEDEINDVYMYVQVGLEKLYSFRKK